MLKNLKSIDINKNNKIKKKFLNADFKKLNLNCNIYKGSFYIDTFNYFLISDDFVTFDNLFSRFKYQNIEHFFTKNFFENFKNNISNFKEFKNGDYKAIMVFAKKARGTMARWIIQNNVQKAEDLKNFTEDGYVFNEELSSENDWIFTR